MTKTSVISIRIPKETEKLLKSKAEILNMKISVLAARVLEEKTEEWAREYAERIYYQLGLEDKTEA